MVLWILSWTWGGGLELKNWLPIICMQMWETGNTSSCSYHMFLQHTSFLQICMTTKCKTNRIYTKILVSFNKHKLKSCKFTVLQLQIVSDFECNHWFWKQNHLWFITPPCIIFAEWYPVLVSYRFWVADSKNSACFAWLCYTFTKYDFVAFLLLTIICEVKTLVLSQNHQKNWHKIHIFLWARLQLLFFFSTLSSLSHVSMILKTLCQNPDFHFFQSFANC